MSKLPGKMTRKQHWVPRFYLHHFADSSGQLHAHSRQKSFFLEMIVRHFKYNAPSLEAHLVTAPDGYFDLKQVNYPERLGESMTPLGVDFTWDIDRSRTLHTRHLKVGDRGSCSTVTWISGALRQQRRLQHRGPYIGEAPHEGVRDHVHED